MKARRQAVILELIDREALHSQEQLRRRLRQRGFDATQATISRDIADLGLVKRAGDGAYQRAGADATNPETALTALERAAAEFLRQHRARPAAGRDPHRPRPGAGARRGARRRPAAGGGRHDRRRRHDSRHRRATRAAPRRSSSGSRSSRPKADSVTMQRIVLAYSGGLETSVAIPWLRRAARRRDRRRHRSTSARARKRSRRFATARSPPARCAPTSSTPATPSPATTSSAR